MPGVGVGVTVGQDSKKHSSHPSSPRPSLISCLSPIVFDIGFNPKNNPPQYSECLQ